MRKGPLGLTRPSSQSETRELADAAFSTYKSAVDSVEAYAASVGGAVDFRYLNYCNGTQDPLRSYGEASLRKMREAAAKYDPAGVFQTRVPGGFKIPGAQPDTTTVLKTVTSTAIRKTGSKRKRRSRRATKGSSLSLSMRSSVLYSQRGVNQMVA